MGPLTLSEVLHTTEIRLVMLDFSKLSLCNAGLCICVNYVCFWVSVCMWWKGHGVVSHSGSGSLQLHCVSLGRPLCSWENHGSISDSILRVWQSAAVWVTLRTATPNWHGAPQGQTLLGCDTSPAWKNAVFLSPSVRNACRFMKQLPVCETWSFLGDSKNDRSLTLCLFELNLITELKSDMAQYSCKGRIVYYYNFLLSFLLLCPFRDKDYHLRTYKSVVMANKLIDWLIAQVSP